MRCPFEIVVAMIGTVAVIVRLNPCFIMSVTLPDNKEGYTMADQTSNEITHVQSMNGGRELQRSKIKTNLSAETQATLQKNTEELGVDVVKKQISIFFKTPFDQLKKL